MKAKFFLHPLLLALLLFIQPTVAVNAGNLIQANSFEDDLEVNGNCTLREAIQAANTDQPVDGCPAGQGKDLIRLAAGEYILSLDEGLVILDSVKIDGMGQSTVIDANQKDRVFHIPDQTTLFEMEDITVTGGRISNGEGAGILNYGKTFLVDVRVINNSVFDTGPGGGIANYGEMYLDDVTVQGNSVSVLGWVGGILNDGKMEIHNSSILENSAEDNAGGIGNDGELFITNTTIRSNRTTWGSGGGILNNGAAVLENVLLEGNVAGSYGGGIRNQGKLEVRNSTFSQNEAEKHGGALASRGGQVSLENVTATANSAGSAGGVWVDGGQVTLHNTLVAGNRGTDEEAAGPDCYGGPDMLLSGGYNLIGDSAGCGLAPKPGDQVGSAASPINPLLAALADNGGPTRTHALLPGSPAVDSGDPARCPAADQRGSARPQDGDGSGTATCDVGAYEAPPVQVTATATISPSQTPDPDQTPHPDLDQVVFIPILRR